MSSPSFENFALENEEQPLLEIRPLVAEELLRRNTQLKALKVIFSIFLTIFASVFLIVNLEFFGFFISMASHHRSFSGVNFITGAVIVIGIFITIMSCFNLLLMKYLKSTVYKVYETKISYKSVFPVYAESELLLSNVAEVSGWQTPEEKQNDMGTIILSAKNSKGSALLFIPDYEKTMSFIKDLINK